MHGIRGHKQVRIRLFRFPVEVIQGMGVVAVINFVFSLEDPWFLGSDGDQGQFGHSANGFVFARIQGFLVEQHIEIIQILSNPFNVAFGILSA